MAQSLSTRQSHQMPLRKSNERNRIALHRQAKSSIGHSMKRQNKQQSSAEMESDTTFDRSTTTPATPSPNTRDPPADLELSPKLITRNIMFKSMEKGASDVAEFWKQKSIEKDEKIRRLEEQLKQMQQDMGEIQEQIVEAVKEARLKQSRAQDYTTVMYDECRELEEINHTQHRLLKERKNLLVNALASAKRMRHGYDGLEKDNLALKRADRRLKHAAQ